MQARSQHKSMHVPITQKGGVGRMDRNTARGHLYFGMKHLYSLHSVRGRGGCSSHWAHLSAGGVDLVYIGVGRQVAGQRLQQHRLADDCLVVFSAVLSVPAQIPRRLVCR